jgi:hypothetical protein
MGNGAIPIIPMHHPQKVIGNIPLLCDYGINVREEPGRAAEPAAIGRKVASVAEQILPSDRGPGAQRGVPRSGL